ncbi:MAG: extracellular solute-binding protein, partial [Candidatus Bathyarchaeia archaeon]
MRLKDLALTRAFKLFIIIAIIVIAGVIAYILWPKSCRADVVIWIQVTHEEEQFIKSFVESSFRQMYPNIMVEINNRPDLKTALLAALPAGKGPDLFMWAHDWMGTIAEPGYITPIDEFVTEELRSKFLDAAWEACIYNGHVYALPYAAETVALIYNKDMVTQPPQTTDQLEDMMYSFSQQGKYGIAYPVDPYYVSAWPHGFGGYYFNDTTKTPGLNTTGTVNGISYFLDKFHDYMSADTGRDAQVALFTGNMTPFLVDGPWGIGHLRERNMNFGVTILPKINEIDAWPKPYTGIKVIWMSSSVYNKQKAFTFMKWFATNSTFIKQRALQFGFIPVLKEVLELPEILSDEIVSAFARQVEMGIPMPKSSEMALVWSPLTDAINELFLLFPTFYGGRTPEVVLSEAQGKVLKALAEYQ